MNRVAPFLIVVAFIVALAAISLNHWENTGPTTTYGYFSARFQTTSASGRLHYREFKYKDCDTSDCKDIENAGIIVFASSVFATLVGLAGAVLVVLDKSTGRIPVVLNSISAICSGGAVIIWRALAHPVIAGGKVDTSWLLLTAACFIWAAAAAFSSYGDSIQVKGNEQGFFGVIGFSFLVAALAIDAYSTAAGGRTEFGAFAVRRDSGFNANYKDDCPVSFPPSVSNDDCTKLEQGGQATLAAALLAVLFAFIGVLLVKFKPGILATIAWSVAAVFSALSWIIWIGRCDEILPTAENTEFGPSTMLLIFSTFGFVAAIYMSLTFSPKLPISPSDHIPSSLGLLGVVFLGSALAVDKWAVTPAPASVYFGSFAARQGNDEWTYDTDCQDVVLDTETCNDLDDGGKGAFALALIAILAALGASFFSFKGNARFGTYGFAIAAAASFLSFLIWITIGADEISTTFGTENGSSFMLTVTAAFILLVAFVFSFGAGTSHSLNSAVFATDPKSAVHLVAILLDVSGYFIFLYAMNGSEPDWVVWHSWLALGVSALLLGLIGFGLEKKFEYLTVLFSLLCIVPLSFTSGSAGVRGAGLQMQLIAMYIVVALPWLFGTGPGGLHGTFYGAGVSAGAAGSHAGQPAAEGAKPGPDQPTQPQQQPQQQNQAEL